MNNPFVKAAILDQLAPPEITSILDRLDILTRNVLINEDMKLTDKRKP